MCDCTTQALSEFCGDYFSQLPYLMGFAHVTVPVVFMLAAGDCPVARLSMLSPCVQCTFPVV
jgi:hypothetical protein